MHKKAMFGAGCFWGVEVAFRQVPGVVDTAVGYAGGTMASPTYEDVCYRDTGHAEVVLVEYEATRLSYLQLLGAFWSAHDPTQKDRQGHDVGNQYRSVIFALDDDQELEARASKAQQEEAMRFPRPIATEIVRGTAFWRAEDYHQRYLEKRGMASSPIEPAAASDEDTTAESERSTEPA